MYGLFYPENGERTSQMNFVTIEDAVFYMTNAEDEWVDVSLNDRTTNKVSFMNLLTGVIVVLRKLATE